MHHHSESKTADATTGPPQNHDTVRFPLSDWGKDAHSKELRCQETVSIARSPIRCSCAFGEMLLWHAQLRVEVEPFSNYWRRSQWHKKSGSQ